MSRIGDEEGRERWRTGDDTSENEWRRKEMERRKSRITNEVTMGVRIREGQWAVQGEKDKKDENIG